MNEPKIIYEVNSHELKTAMVEVLSELTSNAILNRYQGRLVGTKTAAEILGIKEQTVLIYIQANKLKAIRESRVYKFDLKYLLSFNIEDIKYKQSKF